MRDSVPSKQLSQYSKAPASLKGKKIGLLTTDGIDDKLYKAILKAAKAEGATVEIIAPTVGAITSSDGLEILPDHFLSGAPSCLFDCVIIAPSIGNAAKLAVESAAVDWVRDAFGHLKVIGYTKSAEPMFVLASVKLDADEGLVHITGTMLNDYIEQVKKHRIWTRESSVRSF